MTDHISCTLRSKVIDWGSPWNSNGHIRNQQIFSKRLLDPSGKSLQLLATEDASDVDGLNLVAHGAAIVECLTSILLE
jgi:hypothetical protein